jgi:hypothetical protein
VSANEELVRSFVECTFQSPYTFNSQDTGQDEQYYGSESQNGADRGVDLEACPCPEDAEASEEKLQHRTGDEQPGEELVGQTR